MFEKFIKINEMNIAALSSSEENKKWIILKWKSIFSFLGGFLSV